MNNRHILNEEDKLILDSMKRVITAGIHKLLERNVRVANIEIELMKHIKEQLKEK